MLPREAGLDLPVDDLCEVLGHVLLHERVLVANGVAEPLVHSAQDRAELAVAFPASLRTPRDTTSRCDTRIG